MNDLSILRVSYIQNFPTHNDENQYSITVPFMWRENVFCLLRNIIFYSKKEELASLQRM